MKIKFLFILIPFLAISQSKPFYKRTTTAYEISKKDTINKKIHTTYLDSLKKIITTEDNILNAISDSKSKRGLTHSVIEVDTDRLFISVDIDKKGDTIGKLVYVYDEKKNRIENYQVLKGDTLNRQKRVYNEFGKCTKLYNKEKNTNKYYLCTESEYDSKGNITENKEYDKTGRLIRFDKYDNVYKRNKFITTISKHTHSNVFLREIKIIKKGNKTYTYFYSNHIGHNYGIKIRIVAGGMSIQKDDDDGNMKELKIFDADKNLIAYVKDTEIRLEPYNK